MKYKNKKVSFFLILILFSSLFICLINIHSTNATITRVHEPVGGYRAYNSGANTIVVNLGYTPTQGNKLFVFVCVADYYHSSISVTSHTCTNVDFSNVEYTTARPYDTTIHAWLYVGDVGVSAGNSVTVTISDYSTNYFFFEVLVVEYSGISGEVLVTTEHSGRNDTPYVNGGEIAYSGLLLAFAGGYGITDATGVTNGFSLNFNYNSTNFADKTSLSSTLNTVFTSSYSTVGWVTIGCVFENIDDVPPILDSIVPSSYEINKNISVSLNCYDNEALGQFIFSTNVTDSWVNQSSKPLLGMSDTAIAYCVLPSSIGQNVGFIFYVADAVGNWNTTEVYVIVTTGVVNSLIDETCIERSELSEFYSYWYTVGSSMDLSMYKFSVNYGNGSGFLDNEWLEFSAVNNTWANCSLMLNFDLGTVFQWKVSVNNTFGTVYVSEIQNFTVQATVSFFFNDGGVIKRNGTSLVNGTETTYTSEQCLELLAVSYSGFGYLSFNFTDNSSIDNPLLYNVTYPDIIYCNFSSLGEGEEIIITPNPEDYVYSDDFIFVIIFFVVIIGSCIVGYFIIKH